MAFKCHKEFSSEREVWGREDLQKKKKSASKRRIDESGSEGRLTVYSLRTLHLHYGRSCSTKDGSCARDHPNPSVTELQKSRDALL